MFWGEARVCGNAVEVKVWVAVPFVHISKRMERKITYRGGAVGAEEMGCCCQVVCTSCTMGIVFVD
jgi:hypothetical protein